MKRYILLAGIIFVAGLAQAQDWPYYRGPQMNGHTNASVPESPRELWRKELGMGCSAPSVVGNKVYCMGSDGENTTTVYCLDANTGDELWTFPFESPGTKKNFGTVYPGGPTSSPAIEYGRVYIMGRFGQVYALDANTGKPVWHYDIKTEHGLKGQPKWGFSASPLVVDGKVFIEVGVPGASAICLDAQSGKLRWANGDDATSYATPQLVTLAGQRVLLRNNKFGIVAADPETGDEYWRLPWETKHGVNAADPLVLNENTLFLTSGYGKGCALVRVDGNGAKVLWESDLMSNQMAPPVYIEGQIIGFDGKALSAIDPAKPEGKKLWKENAIKPGAVTYADGKLLATNETGSFHIADISGGKYRELFHKTVFEQGKGLQPWTAPVAANGKIFLRNTAGTLVALGE